MITSQAATTAFPGARIAIDCSARSCDARHPLDLESLVQWVRVHPDSSSVHVKLPSLLSGITPRRYQMLLQALGCTVTAKMVC